MQASRILLVLCLTGWIAVGLARVTYHMATSSSQSCYDVCQSRGLICSATNHGFSDSNVVAIFRRLGITCVTNQILAPYSLDTEPFVIVSGARKICSGWKSIPSRISCAGVPSYKTNNVRRLCPCSKTGVKAVSSCSGTPKDIIGSSGVITSPNHPSNYKHGQFCMWRISAPHGHALKLTFTSFHLESHSKCNFDYVKLQDGMAYSSPLLGKYCGDRIPPARYANSGSMVVTFRSDGSVSHGGFRASFTSIPIVTNACSGTAKEFTGFNALIRVPNHPWMSYGHNLKCVWRMTAPEGMRLKISFRSFHLESHSSCNYDYLELRDGVGSGSSVIGKFCGSATPSDKTAQTGSMEITFKTDGSTSHSGFRVFLSAVPLVITGCSGTPKEISGSNGVITSPNFPNSYGRNLRCVWKIQVPSGKRVQLAFTFFKLEGPFCGADVVEIRNGKTDASPRLGRYCGLKAPPTIYADSGSMRITFISDSSVQQQGFHAVFTAVPSNWH